MKNLPNKPSKLIRLALADLALCKADPDYQIDMSIWHMRCYSTKHRCRVCLAGGVISKTLAANINETLSPNNFKSANVKNKLFALDLFRIGEWRHGLGYMNLTAPTGFIVPRWRETKQGYNLAYLGRLANAFEKVGL